MTGAWADRITTAFHSFVPRSQRVWFHTGMNGLSLVTDPEIEYRLSGNGEAITVTRVDRGVAEDEFRTNDEGAVVRQLVRNAVSGRPVSPCVLRPPEGYSFRQAADARAVVEWGQGKWASDLDPDSSLRRGLAWAWVHAASDGDLRAWANNADWVDLWSAPPCPVPPLFAFRLTVARWEEWLDEQNRART